MIVTVTCNPAIDQNVSVDRLVFDDRAYILDQRHSAGGRGINASCVIHAFGGQTLALAISGGKSGRLMEEYLSTCGFAFELVRIRHEIRKNITVSDKQGLAVRLNEVGPRLQAPELSRLEKAVRERLKSASHLMLCGSLPPGVRGEFYATLVKSAGKLGVPVLVDTDGEALERAVEAGPDVVTPNQQEAERLLNRALITRQHFFEAAARIREMGARSVILSMGARGAVAAGADGTLLEVAPPRVDALCSIGSGDALGAAYAWAITNGQPFAEAVRWGVAAGTASARLPGLSFASLGQTKEVLEQVEVRRIQ